MKHEVLTDWELLALTEAMRSSVERGESNAEHGRALLAKLERAAHVRVTYREQTAPSGKFGNI